jgi:hypothetical protein
MLRVDHENFGSHRFNLDLERMYRNLDGYWADSKGSQPLTPGGATIHISSRFIVGALWLTGITLVNQLREILAMQS